MLSAVNHFEHTLAAKTLNATLDGIFLFKAGVQN